MTKHKLLTLFVVFITTTAIGAQNNVITYTATEKLSENPSDFGALNTKAFNASITSHTFDDGVGTITFDDDVISIGKSAFEHCIMTSITIPSSVTSIGDYAFLNCYNISFITIPSSVTTIGNSAFSACFGLISITIPSSVTSIGTEAFAGCSDLTSIYVESENPNYDSRDKCNAIIETATNTLITGCQNTTIPSSVTSIGDYAFDGCRSLTFITIPSSVTSIGIYAFWGCSSLTSITIPSSVTSISIRAFNNCNDLTSIYVESGNTKYDSRDNCNAIIETATNTLITGCQNTTIPSSVTSIGDWAFENCRSLTSITIPSSVTSIGRDAFFGCSSLTSITIPSSVTAIGIAAFVGCSGLTSIYVELENQNYDSRDSCNAIIETVTNTLVSGCKSTTIPSSVTSIGNSAFNGCSSLTSITIPSSVKKIEHFAFFSCHRMTSITIPSSVTSIGNAAFGGCIGLTAIICEATTPPSFRGQYLDYSIPLYVPTESIDAYKMADVWKEFTNIQTITL